MNIFTASGQFISSFNGWAPPFTGTAGYPWAPGADIAVNKWNSTGKTLTVFVSNPDTGFVYELAYNGTTLRKWAAGTPGALALSQRQILFVAYASNSTISSFNVSVSAIPPLITSWGSYGSGDAQFSYPYGLAIDEISDRVYVADSGNSRIQVFTFNGTFLFRFGSRGTTPGQFGTRILGIAVRGSTVYCADHRNRRVQLFSKNGTFLTQWNASVFNAPIAYYYPWAIAASATSERIWVSAHSFSVYGVPRGWVKGVATMPTSDDMGPVGTAQVFQVSLPTSKVNASFGRNVFVGDIASNAAEDIFVVRSGGGFHGRMIQKYSAYPNLTLLREWGGPGSGSGLFNPTYGPTSVSLNPNCTILYVADPGNSLVQLFNSSTGDFLSQWDSTFGGRTNCSFPATIRANPQTGDVVVACWLLAFNVSQAGLWAPVGQMVEIIRDGVLNISFRTAVNFSAAITHLALAVDNSTNIYVSSVQHQMVLKYSRQGVLLQTIEAKFGPNLATPFTWTTYNPWWTAYGPVQRRNGPYGLDVDVKSGEIFWVDDANQRVLRLSPSGMVLGVIGGSFQRKTPVYARATSNFLYTVSSDSSSIEVWARKFMFTCSEDNGPWQECSFPYFTSNRTTGNHSLQIRNSLTNTSNSIAMDTAQWFVCSPSDGYRVCGGACLRIGDPACASPSPSSSSSGSLSVILPVVGSICGVALAGLLAILMRRRRTGAQARARSSSVEGRGSTSTLELSYMTVRTSSSSSLNPSLSSNRLQTNESNSTTSTTTTAEGEFPLATSSTAARSSVPTRGSVQRQSGSTSFATKAPTTMSGSGGQSGPASTGSSSLATRATTSTASTSAARSSVPTSGSVQRQSGSSSLATRATTTTTSGGGGHSGPASSTTTKFASGRPSGLT